MALKQTKIIRKKFTKQTMKKDSLAKKLNTTTAKINEYILGDDKPNIDIKIIPTQNGIVEVEFYKEISEPKYEGVYYNELKNGDKTFYISYKDLATNKKQYLKIGKESAGITEKYCFEKRDELIKKMKDGEKQTKIRNKRVIKDIITFDILFDMYLKHQSIHLDFEKLKGFKARYENHIKSTIGDMDINEIKTTDIEKIMRKRKDKLANATINHIIENISSIYKFAIEKGLFKGLNPTINIDKLHESNERTKFLSKEEIRLLINESKFNDILYLFTMLSLTTGGRFRTICSIKIKDIKLENMFIDLQDFKNQTFYKGFIKKDEYFLDKLKEQMKNKKSNDYLLVNESLKKTMKFISSNMSKIFKVLFNSYIDEDKSKYTAEALAEIRRDKVVIHTLRHTFASQLVINGTPIFTVKNLMNHKDIKQTMRYAKLAPNSGRDFVNQIY